MKDRYQVVIIGGGVVGVSVLYHLAKYGWTDCVVLERSVMAAGSSWHAAGGVHALNADPNMSALQGYTLDLLSKIQEESGQDIGLHMTGGVTIASTPDRWEWLQAAYRTYQTIGIEDVHLLTPSEVKNKCPIMDTKGVLGGLWADREGYVDTTGTVWAYAKAAKKLGAEVVENNKVHKLEQQTDGTWKVHTDKGIIAAEHVVNAGGLWAKQVGRMVGLELPVSPLKHHYLVTETIPAVKALDFEVPMTVDLEGFTYMRQWDDGILIGIYEINHEHWAIDGAPWDFGMELFKEDFDRIENELALSFERYPDLNTVGIKNWVNGAFTFSPDGNPLVGPVRGLRNYWLACGVMAGFLQGGGVGKTLAEWMIYGETEADAWSMDIARYGKFASNKDYIKQTTGQFYSRRFVMSYPNEQLPAGRDMKRTGVYDAQKSAGAIFGNSWGLEVPLMFGSKNFVEEPSLRRSNAFDFVKKEHLAVREDVGILDSSGFSRFEIRGKGATQWLNQLFSTDLPNQNKVKLAVMLGHDGRLKGDLTCFNWGEDHYWVMGSYYLREWHLRWFHDHLPGGKKSLETDGEVFLTDISDNIGGYAVSGPNARALLQKLTDQDITNDNFRFMSCQEIDIGLIRAKVGRLSVAGELGFEINCHALELNSLREMLLNEGKDLGVKEYGYYALNTLRLEKSFGIWNAEFMQAYSPLETGMDKWVSRKKNIEFVGQQASLRELENGKEKLEKVLVTLEIENAVAEASGYEPIWLGDKRIGMTTSGGFGHSVNKSLAMALIKPEFSIPGSKLKTHIVGVEKECTVLEQSPWDPTGGRMRL